VSFSVAAPVASFMTDRMAVGTTLRL
jgi:hypothetical protein